MYGIQFPGEDFCPGDWLLNPYINQCFHLARIPRNFADAAVDCRQKGGHVATATAAYINDVLISKGW